MRAAHDLTDADLAELARDVGPRLARARRREDRVLRRRGRLAVRDAGVCHHVAMSDDDLWSRRRLRRTSPPPRAGAGAPGVRRDPAVSGVGGQPEAAADAEPAAPAQPPSPRPRRPPSGHVPPPANPYGAPSEHTAPPAQNPDGATTPYPTAQPAYGQPYGQQPDPLSPTARQYGQPGGAYPPPPVRPPIRSRLPPTSSRRQPDGSPYSAALRRTVPDHPRRRRRWCLGIVGLVGIFICQVLLSLAGRVGHGPRAVKRDRP